jgi:hypothetical protein
VTIADLPLTAKDGSAEAWLVNNDGNRVTTINDNVQFAGLIIGRKYNIADASYELELLLTNFRVGQPIRWRAPAMVIDSLGAPKVYAADTSTFGYFESDALSFTVGDEVSFWQRDGAKHAESQSVVAVGTDGTGSFIQLDSFPSAGLSPSFIVRLDDSSVYDNSSIFSCDLRPWVFFGDASQTIDEQGTDVEADIYG